MDSNGGARVSWALSASCCIWGPNAPPQRKAHRRIAGLRPLMADDQLEVLRLLVDRPPSIGEEHTREVSRLHALLASVRPHDVVGKARKRASGSGILTA
jgi:hypothetical protein